MCSFCSIMLTSPSFLWEQRNCVNCNSCVQSAYNSSVLQELGRGGGGIGIGNIGIPGFVGEKERHAVGAEKNRKRWWMAEDEALGTVCIWNNSHLTQWLSSLLITSSKSDHVSWDTPRSSSLYSTRSPPPPNTNEKKTCLRELSYKKKHHVALNLNTLSITLKHIFIQPYGMTAWCRAPWSTDSLYRYFILFRPFGNLAG